MRNKGLLAILLALLLTSCDFILKDKKDLPQDKTEFITNGGKEVIGDTDKNGCTTSAGYKWSSLRKDCIRVFEEGFRLNPIEDQVGSFENELEDNDVSCFVIFSQDRKQAEVFLPLAKESIILNSDTSNKIYTNKNWKLQKENLLLSYQQEPKFSAAKTIEMEMIIPKNQTIEDIQEDNE